MPANGITLLTIAQMNNTDDVTGLIEESIQAHPEIRLGSARTIRGTHYKTLIRTNIPIGGFRDANEGNPSLKNTYANKLVETFIVDSSVEMDKAVADAHEDGWQVVMALEAEGVMEGQMRGLTSQMYYGRSTDVATSTALNPLKGFPGLVDLVDSDLVEDAGGTTASTASSTWAVRWGAKHLQWVFGLNGEINSDDVRVVRVTDNSGNPYDAYRKPMLTYIGLQMVNKNSIARIKNITEDSGKTMTDDLVAQMLTRFPVGHKPDQLFMTKRSLEQLRKSRTSITQNATGQPTPTPTESHGIPIEETDSIVNTEELG